MSRPIVFLDTETDSLGPNRKIWDVAIIRRDENGVEDNWQAYVKIDLSTANLAALYIGHFYDRHPVGRYLSGAAAYRPALGGASGLRSRGDVAQAIAKLTHGATIVGAVPNFDTEALEKLLRAHGLAPSWHHRLCCVETLTAGYLGRQIGGLDACAEALNIPKLDPATRHTALGDATWTRDIYDAVMSRKALAR